MFFPKNIGINLNNKYSQKRLDSAKKSAADAIKTAEATGYLIGKNIADKITSDSKKYSQNNLEALKSEQHIPKNKYIPQEKRQ